MDPSEAGFVVATWRIGEDRITWLQIIFEERQVTRCCGKGGKDRTGISLFKCGSQYFDARGHGHPFDDHSLALIA